MLIFNLITRSSHFTPVRDDFFCKFVSSFFKYELISICSLFIELVNDVARHNAKCASNSNHSLTISDNSAGDGNK